MDWIVHVVAKNQTRLSDFHFLFLLKQIYLFSYIKETYIYIYIYIQYLKIHQFEVYGSVIFSTLAELFSQLYHSIILECFQYPRKKLFTHQQTFIIHATLHPQPQGPSNQFSVSCVCLFWTFHIYGIIKYVVFCD